MDCTAAKKFVTKKLLVLLYAFGFGAILVFAGLFFGIFDLVLCGWILTVAAPILVFRFVLEPIWDAVEKMRLVGRSRPPEDQPELEVSAPQSIFSPSLRPPRLILA